MAVTLCKCRVLVYIEREQKGYSHPNTCQSVWIEVKSLNPVILKRKFFALSFSVNSILSKLSSPAYTSSSFWGFAICFDFGLCVGGLSPHVTHFFYYSSSEFFYHLSSPSSSSHYELSFGNLSLRWLQICCLPHFTPKRPLSTPAHYSTITCCSVY